MMKDDSSEIKRTSAAKYLKSPFLISLKTLASKDTQEFGNYVWENLLFTQIPNVFTKRDVIDLDLCTADIAIDFYENNAQTSNFSLLMMFLLSRLRKMRMMDYNGDWPQETHNSLFAVRIILKYLVQRSKKTLLVEFFQMERRDLAVEAKISAFNGKLLDMDGGVLMDKRPSYTILIEEILHVITYSSSKSPVNYQFYVDTLELLFALISSQLKSPPSSDHSQDLFLHLIMLQFSHFSSELMSRLLCNFIEQQAPYHINSGLFMSAYSLLFSPPLLEGQCPISDHSLLILLLLSNQAIDKASYSWKESILIQSVKEPSSPAESEIRLTFKLVYDQIVKSLGKDETVIFLYLMLIRNNHFKIYFLSRSDPEEVLLVIFKLMNDGIEESRPLKILYLILDILLILSQDSIYAKNIQIINISSPGWYSERSLRNITLGGLLLLLTFRLLSLNLTKFHDSHIHITTIGILTNLSPYIYQMETVVAQRLTSLLENTSKRIQKHIEVNETSIIMTAYSDVLACILELINTIITHSLKDNPQLTYILLPRRELFLLYKEYVRFKPLVDNIEVAIDFFGSRIDETEVTVDSIFKIIDEAGYSWGSSRIEVYETVRFSAEEETDNHLVLVPMIWRVALNAGAISWEQDHTPPLLN